MTEPSRPRVKYVIGPDGSPLTIADLPPPSTRRWVIRRKAEVVAAVRGGLLSLEEACKRYTLTTEEFLSWQMSIDQHGLAHPLAARMPPLRPRVLAGHEKELPQDWALAEAGGPGEDPGSARAQAAEARGCGPAGRVLDAVDGAITPSRFLRNLLRAPALTLAEVPEDPADALAACDPA